MAGVLGKAIRAKCLDCTCNQIAEVRKCPIERCPLHPFRMGKNPFSNRKGNPNLFKKSTEPTNPE